MNTSEEPVTVLCLPLEVSHCALHFNSSFNMVDAESDCALKIGLRHIPTHVWSLWKVWRNIQAAAYVSVKEISLIKAT